MFKILYIDMDNVLVDFQSGIDQTPESTFSIYEKGPQSDPDEVPGIFSRMQPMAHAVDSVTYLARHFDCYVLSTAPWKNPLAWAEKVLWIQTWFPDIFYKKVIISHNKHLNKGDYLIDDSPRNGAEHFAGKWIPFDPENKDSEWSRIVEYLKQQEGLG